MRGAGGKVIQHDTLASSGTCANKSTASLSLSPSLTHTVRQRTDLQIRALKGCTVFLQLRMPSSGGSSKGPRRLIYM